jgi:hypothetical protein
MCSLNSTASKPSTKDVDKFSGNTSNSTNASPTCNTYSTMPIDAQIAPPHPTTPILLLRIMRNNLNLNPHIILPQPLHTHTRPNRLVIRHPFLELPRHNAQRLVVQWHMVTIHAKHLGPALAAGVTEAEIDIGEGLLDLRIDVGVVDAGLGVPAAWGEVSMGMVDGL